MNDIPYSFHRNLHSVEGARNGLARILADRQIASLLDVGAGIGTWLNAAREMGLTDIAGIDGTSANANQLHVERALIEIRDLRQRIDLGRSFDAVLCLEVAEHLDERFAATLIETVCRHGDLVIFSAAAPGQHGEHHVNCQWPSYWQALFNAQGFVCYDDVRFNIWNDGSIEPWYRQNIFSAARSPNLAGNEPRLISVIHPDMTYHMDLPNAPISRRYKDLSEGRYSPLHYARLLARSVTHKVRRGMDLFRQS
jgi:hypothetical protein